MKTDEIAPAIAVQVFHASQEEQERFKLNLDMLKEKGTEALLGAGATLILGAIIEGARLVFGS